MDEKKIFVQKFEIQFTATCTIYFSYYKRSAASGMRASNRTELKKLGSFSLAVPSSQSSLLPQVRLLFTSSLYPPRVSAITGDNGDPLQSRRGRHGRCQHDRRRDVRSRQRQVGSVIVQCARRVIGWNLIEGRWSDCALIISVALTNRNHQARQR